VDEIKVNPQTTLINSDSKRRRPAASLRSQDGLNYSPDTSDAPGYGRASDHAITSCRSECINSGHWRQNVLSQTVDPAASKKCRSRVVTLILDIGWSFP
jgi:hypothetical protein